MADPFLAEIRIFAGNFPIYGWAFCNGQIMSISQNTALFSLLGTNYGGDGKSNFGLPDIQGRVVIGAGSAPGLSTYTVGEMGGTPYVTLLTSELPRHNHTAFCDTGGGAQSSPIGGVWAEVKKSKVSLNYYAPTSDGTQMSSTAALTVTGSSLPHNNMQPYLALNYIIALQGVFPQRG